MGIQIKGTGHYVPERILTNFDLEKMVETSDEWIVTRTGIRQRHIAEAEVRTSEIAAQAGLAAIESAGLTAADIDLVVVSTITPDMATPSTATFVQTRLGIPPCMCFDLEAACSGLLYAIDVVHALLASGQRKTALVIGAEKLSSITNWTDRSTCVLFGDGASALVIQSDPSIQGDFYIAGEVGADGAEAAALMVPGFGTASPATPEGIANHSNCLVMNGPKTYQMAVNSMSEACRKVLEKTGISADEVRWMVPHQANNRIIDSVAKKLNISGAIYRNVERFGNTSSASVGICLDELNRSGQLQRGDLVLLAAFGAGFTWAAELIRW